MNLTITSDASFSRKYQVGTYAYAMVCNEGRFKASGQLKGKIEDPTEAEMKCILNALSLLVNSNVFDDITRIYINTDSMNAIQLFTNDHIAIDKYHLLRKKSWKSLRKIYNKSYKALLRKKEVNFLHVKAHTDTNDKRSFVNAWCDTQAKAEMNKLITHIENTQHENQQKRNAVSA